MIFIQRLIIVVLLTGCLNYDAFSQGNAAKNKYAAGYREYAVHDTSRLYKPGTGKEHGLYFRPVSLDVWYPAKNSAKRQALPYSYFLSIFEKRANSFQDSITYTGMADELAQHIGISTKPRFTQSYRDAEEVNSTFPLIVYLSAFNGMSYENVPLFESLAGQGYIVVSISSVGRYPGNMTTKYPDLLEQVNDAAFAIGFMQNKHIDSTRIGVAGYSYGGLAAAVLASKNQTIKAVLSLDGSELHTYGEDRDFDLFRKSVHPAISGWKCSYAYIASDQATAGESTYRLPLPAGIKKSYLKLNGAEHEDFSMLSEFSRTAAQGPYSLVNNLAVQYFNQFLQDSTAAFDNEVKAIIKANKGTDLATEPSNVTDQVTLRGMVIAAGSKLPLQYVSIGIPSGNQGTVSATDGSFVLKLVNTADQDTIRFSSLGFQQRIFTRANLLGLLYRDLPIALREKNEELHEVKITGKRSHTIKKGNTSRSKFFSVGFPLKDLGSEAGIKISLGNKNVVPEAFNFHISYLHLDSATFRFNVYAFKNGRPAENLLNQNILISIGKKPGPYTLDLRPYNLLLKGDILVSLEWIDGQKGRANGDVFFSAGLLSSSYHRKTTEARWTRSGGLGAGFSLLVQQ